jgi:aerobic carbon-monoxide dehydrogenase medium subunit
MKPAPFAFSRPATLDEAVRLLAEANGAARPLAGGQSLVPMLNLRLAPVEHIVDLGAIAELRRTAATATAIRYGAMTPHSAFEDGEVPDGSNGLMPHVAARFAFRAVRNRGTIGGALALADPAADWLPTMVALDAVLHVVGPEGRRAIPAAEFVLGPYFTALAEGELIEAIEVPRRPASERWGYSKVTAKIGEYAESLAIAIIDREQRTARAVLGASDGAPLVLAESVAPVLRGERAETLGEAIRAELLAAERDFAPAKLVMHTTTLLRAIRDAAA